MLVGRPRTEAAAVERDPDFGAVEATHVGAPRWSAWTTPRRRRGRIGRCFSQTSRPDPPSRCCRRAWRRRGSGTGRPARSASRSSRAAGGCRRTSSRRPTADTVRSSRGRRRRGPTWCGSCRSSDIGRSVDRAHQGGHGACPGLGRVRCPEGLEGLDVHDERQQAIEARGIRDGGEEEPRLGSPGLRVVEEVIGADQQAGCARFGDVAGKVSSRRDVPWEALEKTNSMPLLRSVPKFGGRSNG